MTNWHIPSSVYRKLRTPAIISSILVLPFTILELMNRRNFQECFPIALFVFMWLLSLSFILVLTPIVRNSEARNRNIANPLGLLPRIAFLVLVTWVWMAVVLDQMPCFLGVPNCD